MSSAKDSLLDSVGRIGAVEARRRIEDFLRGEPGDLPHATSRPVVDLSSLPEGMRRAEMGRMSTASKMAGFVPVLVAL